MPITIHPDTSGRPREWERLRREWTLTARPAPDVLLMLERFIRWVNEHDGVEWVAMEEIAEDFRAKNKPPLGAVMPKGM